MLLEARAGRAVRARPPQGAGGERLGAPGAGGADQHAAALREDDLGLDVCGGDDVGRAERRDQHLQHVQAHLAEAAAQLRQVLLRGLQAGPGGGGLQGGPSEHGGDRAARPRRRARRACSELVPEQGWRGCGGLKSQLARATRSACARHALGVRAPKVCPRAARAKSLPMCCAKSGRGATPHSIKSLLARACCRARIL